MPMTIQDRRAEMISRLPEYVRREILPRFALSGEFRLVPAVKGRRSIVVFLECDGRRFVLKCHTEVVRALRTYFAHRHIEGRGGPVPRLLSADFSPRTRLELGCFVLVEEAFDGRLLQEFERRDLAIRDAAVALARFHDIRSDGYGALFPLVRRRRGYFDAVMRRITRRLEHLGGVAKQFRPLLAPALVEWFERFRDRVEDGSPYELTHLRMTGTNVLVANDGGARVIDLVTSRYARAGFDLVSALHRWCHDDAQREVMLESYFATRRTLTREQLERDFAFYHAWFHFSQAHDKADAIARWERSSAVSGRGAAGEDSKARRRNAMVSARRHLHDAWIAIRDSDVAMSSHLLAALRSTFIVPARRKGRPRRGADRSAERGAGPVSEKRARVRPGRAQSAREA